MIFPKERSPLCEKQFSEKVFYSGSSHKKNDYKSFKISSHSAAVAEKLGGLKKFYQVVKRKKQTVNHAVDAQRPRSTGKKRATQVRKGRAKKSFQSAFTSTPLSTKYPTQQWVLSS